MSDPMIPDTTQPLDALRDAIADFVLSEKTELLQNMKVPQEERRVDGPLLYERIDAMLAKVPALRSPRPSSADLREAIHMLEEAEEVRRILRPEWHQEWSDSLASENQSYASWLAGKALAILRPLLAAPVSPAEGGSNARGD